MALTPEELAELEALEKEERKAADTRADAALRQRLEAKRMRKRLAGKHGEHGLDYVVIETTTGLNVALRRPHDVEVDALEDAKDDEKRAAMEKFITALVLEPTQAEVQEHLAKFCGLAGTFAPAVNTMMGRVREEEAKK